MALLKEIEMDNGIILNYHRIVAITKITNKLNVIEVASYVSKKKREEEKQAIEEGQRTGKAVQMNVYIETDYINKEYDAEDTIENLYSYLKTTEKFKDAKDA